jgi:hypothetical protein
MEVPVILVANKIDQIEDRVITTEEGHNRSQEIGCMCFHEISVSESVDEVQEVFRDICRFLRVYSIFPKLKRSKSDSLRLSLHSESDAEKIICDLQEEKRRPILLFRRSRSAWHDEEHEEELDELPPILSTNEPFRTRAQTDGNLLISRTRKSKIISPIISPPQTQMQSSTLYNSRRRNSVSMRGHVSY